MCGRVVCHACASSMLFYEASGKRQRTCDECIRNGGPPPSRLANEFNQKSIFTLVKEQKAAYDASQKEEGTELPPGIQMNKHSRVATWADWGVVPGTPTLAESDEDQAAGISLKFTVYLPVGANPGDTVEVALPTPDMVPTPKSAEPKGGVAAFFRSAITAPAPAPSPAPAGPSTEETLKGLASSVICVVGPDGSVDRSNPDFLKMPVELRNGVDGIVFAMPPKQVCPFFPVLFLSLILMACIERALFFSIPNCYRLPQRSLRDSS